LLTPIDKRLRRCALAHTPPFTPTNTAVVGLFNNTTGPHLIVVWDFSVNAASETVAQGYYFLKGPLTETDGAGVSVVTDEATAIGLAQHDDLSSIPTTVYDYDNFAEPNANPQSFPLAILKPGWTCVFVCSATATAWGGTFYYEWFHPDKLVEWELP